MTADEALAAVKKAVEWRDWCETRSHREASEIIRSRFRTLAEALRAIGPDGPLVVVPVGSVSPLSVVPTNLEELPIWFNRFLAQQSVETTIVLHDLCHARMEIGGISKGPSRSTYQKHVRAMIAASEKQT